MDSKAVTAKLKIVHRVRVVGENMQAVNVDVTNKPSPYQWGWYDAQGTETVQRSNRRVPSQGFAVATGYTYRTRSASSHAD